MSNSLFVTFEGPEGGGKTTQIELLKSRLTQLGYDVLVTRQPGGDAIGKELRKIMLEIGREKVSPRAELLMMIADRTQSVDMIIRPHLRNGGIVICDRYVDSSVAYQGGGRGIDKSWIKTLNAYAVDGLMPEVTFLLDIDPATGLLRQNEHNRMELEDRAFHTRVREAYLEIADEDPSRVKVINAARPIADVHVEIKAHLAELIHV